MTEVAAPSPPRYILAPFVPTPPEVVERMLDLAGVTSADTVYDLGCGDGRIVIAAAQRGARAVGVDIEPHWVAESTRNAAAAGVSGSASFELQDALAADLSPATVVMLYLVEWSTRMLDEKLAAELRPGARIVSHSFGMGDRPAEKTEQWVDSTGRAADAAALDRRQGRHRTGRRERLRPHPAEIRLPRSPSRRARRAHPGALRAARRLHLLGRARARPGTSGWSSPRSLRFRHRLPLPALFALRFG